MDNNTGFICLHRSLENHWLAKDRIKLTWWIDILWACNYEPKTIPIKGFDISVERGQTLRSIRSWAKQWHVTTGIVDRFFEALKKEGMIATENLGVTTLTTVSKYSYYNGEMGEIKSTKKVSRKLPAKTAGGYHVSVNVSENVSENVSDNEKAPNNLRVASCRLTEHKTDHETCTENKESLSKESLSKETIRENEIENKNTTAEDNQDVTSFTKFQNVLKRDFPRVATMKQPFTIKQFLTLKNKYLRNEKEKKDIRELFEAMENRPDLHKNYLSSYLTIIRWHANGVKRGTIVTAEPIYLDPRFKQIN